MDAVAHKIGRIKYRMHTRYFIDYDRNYAKSVFLSGTGRSGTTWVSNIINYKNDHRYIFEPFHPCKVGLCRQFKNRQYIRPESRDSRFLEPVRAILSGRIRNRWTDDRNGRFVCGRRLIKDIRANNLIKWIQTHFPRMPIALLFRHPCAVANSKLQKGWKSHLGELLAQDELMADFLHPFKKDMEKAKTMFEQYIFLWCAENYVPLRQFRPGEVHLAFYENFCETPREEIRRLFAFLNREFDESVLESLGKPSAVSRRESAVMTGESLTDSWRKHITAEQAERAVEILSLFGLDKIYSHDSMPDVANAYAMMGENGCKPERNG